jgi:4-carboxymuconolactone decarboxylase
VAISEEARRNHDAQFPDHTSTLTRTDPELIEIFDNWAFDEVLRDGTLDARTRLMVQMAALIACQAVNEYRVMLGGALNVGVTPVEVKEIVYQSVPYVGMARAFDVLHVTNEALQSRGIELPLEGQSTTNADSRFEKGLALQRRLFGDRIEQIYAHSPKDTLHIQRHLSANCFGDYYTRKGLDLKTRELLTFAMIASLGGCEPQLGGHVAANLSVGNDRQTLLSTVTQLLPFIGYPRTLNAIRIIDEGTSARSEELPVTKALILGANGQLARNTTRFFLERTDAHLTLYLRRASRLRNPDLARVTMAEGDVLDRPTLEAAMQRQDVVYANLAGAMAQQARVIVNVMKAAGLKRLIFISSMGIYGEVPGETYRRVLDPYRDSAAVIEASDLDYTILRPGWFTHDEAIDYRITQKGEPFRGREVSLNSLSDLIVKLAFSPTMEVRCSLGVSRA